MDGRQWRWALLSYGQGRKAARCPLGVSIIHERTPPTDNDIYKYNIYTNV